MTNKLIDYVQNHHTNDKAVFYDVHMMNGDEYHAVFLLIANDSLTMCKPDDHDNVYSPLITKDIKSLTALTIIDSMDNPEPKIYSYDELTNEGKQQAIDWYREDMMQDDMGEPSTMMVISRIKHGACYFDKDGGNIYID